MPSLQMAAIRHCDVPTHVYACAKLYTQHLRHGSEWAVIPAAGIEHITEGSWWDTMAEAQEVRDARGGCVVLIAEDIASVLRAYIPTLPETLYINHEFGDVSETEPEPEGWRNEEDEPCDEGDFGAAYIDNTAEYDVYKRWDLVRALFGTPVANEFS